MSPPMGGFGDNNPMSADNSFAINSKIMIVAVVVLFGVVMFIMGLHIYAKWFWRHGGQNGGSRGGGWRRRRRLEFAADWPEHHRTTHVGLEKSVLDQLPTFTFDEQKASVNEGAMECAVCLEEFAEGEKGRLLPKCNHSFHIDCIDMWFHSHSTCPLCRCSVAPEGPPSAIQQQPDAAAAAAAQTNGAVGLQLPSGDVVVRISDGGVTSVSGDYYLDNHQERSQTLLRGGEQGPEFLPSADSAAAAGGAGVGFGPPRQQQQQGSRPASPSSRRSSTGLSPKPPGIQYPANVLFWGNQTQMNAAGAGTGVVSGGPREENSGRRRFSSGVHALNSLVIEIPRALPPDATVGHAAENQNNSTSSDDAQGGAGSGGPRSPIGRLVTSSFRRLLSRRGPTSPGPDVICSFDYEQQQASTISSSAGATPGSRPS